MNPDLHARCEKRLADIRRTQDRGLYARFYTEDIMSLLAEIAELQRTLDQQGRT